jgi:hypothetical protein
MRSTKQRTKTATSTDGRTTRPKNSRTLAAKLINCVLSDGSLDPKRSSELGVSFAGERPLTLVERTGWELAHAVLREARKKT